MLSIFVSLASLSLFVRNIANAVKNKLDAPRVRLGAPNAFRDSYKQILIACCTHCLYLVFVLMSLQIINKKEILIFNVIYLSVNYAWNLYFSALIFSWSFYMNCYLIEVIIDKMSISLSSIMPSLDFFAKRSIIVIIFAFAFYPAYYGSVYRAEALTTYSDHLTIRYIGVALITVLIAFHYLKENNVYKLLLAGALFCVTTFVLFQ